MEQNFFQGIDFSADNINKVAETEADYSSSIDPRQILKDPRFLQDLRDYFSEREGRTIGWSDEELIEAFYADGTFRELNTASAVGGAFEPWGMGEDQRSRVKRIETVWKNLPYFWQQGGRGFASAVPDIAGGILSDPINYIPGIAGAKIATQGIVKGGKFLGSVLKGTGAAALTEGAISGTQEAAINASTQLRDKQLGLRDEFSWGEVGTAGAIGGALGLGVGGAMGIPGALAGAKVGTNIVEDLMAKGLTREQIAALPKESLAGYQEVAGILPPARQTDEVVAETAETAEDTPITIDELIDAQTKETQRLIANGVAPEDGVNEANSFLTLLKAAKKFEEEQLPATEALIAAYRRKGTPLANEKADEIQNWLNKRQMIFDTIKRQEVPEEFAGDVDRVNAWLKDNPYGKEQEAINRSRIKVSGTGRGGRTDAGEMLSESEAAELDAQRAKEGVADADADADVTDADAAAADAAAEAPVKTEDDIADELVTGVLDTEAQRYDEGVEDFLRSKGFDPSSVKGRKKDGKVTMTMAKKAIRSGEANRSVDSVELQTKAQDDYDRAIQELSDEWGEEALPDEIKLKVREVLAKDKGIDSDLIDIRGKGGAVEKEMAVIKSHDDWVVEHSLTDAEQKLYGKIKRRVKSQHIGKPEWTPSLITAKARTMFLNQRKKQGDARLSGDKIDRDSVFTTTGRNEDGRIQGILKKGDVTDRKGLRKSDVTTYGDRESAYVVSKRAAKNDERRLVPFYTQNKLKVLGLDNKEIEVPVGTEVWADGYTRKVFVDRDTALVRTGFRKSVERPLPTKVNTKEAVMEAVSNNDVNALTDLLNAIIRGEGAAGAKVNKNAVDSGTPTGTVDDVPSPKKGDKVLIARNKNNPDDVRMLSNKQVRDGKGLQHIIGQKKGTPDADPNNWEVRYAPASERVFGKRLKSLFDSLPDETGSPTEGGRFESGGATGAGEPIDVKDAHELELELTEDDVLSINSYNRFLDTQNKKDLYGREFSGKLIPVSTPGDKVTIKYENIRDAMRVLSMRLKWQNTIDSHNRLIKVYESFMDMEARVLPPEGFADTTAKRADALKAIKSVFNGRSAAEVNIAYEIVRRLGGDPTIGPRFKQSYEGRDYFSTGPTSKILADEERYTTNNLRGMTSGGWAEPSMLEEGLPFVAVDPYGRSINVFPASDGLLHELSHWGFDNILTSKDRLYFLKSMSKYFDEKGRLDKKAIDEGLPSSELNIANAYQDPQEFFANQFVAWANRRNKELILKDEGFWKKITSYIKAMLERFYYETPIDADLENLFLKILPDEIETKKRVFGTDNARTPAGKAIEQRHTQLLDIDARLRGVVDAWHSDPDMNPETVINEFTDITGYILSNLVYNKQKTGPFNMLNAYSKKLIRERLQDINDIMKMNSSSGKQIDWTELRAKVDANGENQNIGVSIIDPDKQADAAEMLVGMYEDGYRSKVFKGGERFEQYDADGNFVGYDYPKIKDLSRSSMKYQMNNAIEGLETKWAHVENSNKIMRNSRIEEPEATRSKHKQQGKGKSKAWKRVANKQKQDDSDALDKAEKEVNTKRPDRKTKPNTNVSPSDAKELKTLNLKQLVNLYKVNADTDFGQQIAEMITRKLKTRSMPKINSDNVKVPRDIVEMRKPEIDAAMRQATLDGDNKRLQLLQLEITRRANKRKAKSKGLGTSDFVGYIGRSSKIEKNIEIEARDSVGVQNADGIPANARPMVKEMLSYMTHRRPEIEMGSRTIMYRMLNILGKVSRSDSNLNTINEVDISKLAGTNYYSKGDADFNNYSGDDFKKFRNDVRVLAGKIMADGDAPRKNQMRDLSATLLRASLTKEQKNFLATAFNADADAASTTREVFMKLPDIVALKNQGYSDELLNEMMVIEWFSDFAEKNMSGKAGVIQITNRMSGGTQSRLHDSYSEGEVFQEVSRILGDNREQVAYVLNGLVKSDSFKNDYYGVTTLYGDMFVKNNRKGMEFPMENGSVFHSSYAAEMADSSWSNASSVRKNKIKEFTAGGVGYNPKSKKPNVFYHGTPHGKAFDGSDTSTVMRLSNSNAWFGRGIYLTENPVIAEHSYAKQSTVDSFSKQISSMPEGELRDEIEDIVYELSAIRGYISKLKKRNARLALDKSEDAGTIQQFLEKTLLEDTIVSSISQERALASQLETKGIKVEPYVMPSYIRLLNPADFRERKIYAVDDPIISTLMQGYHSHLHRLGHSSDEITDTLESFAEHIQNIDYMSGEELRTSIEGMYIPFAQNHTMQGARDMFTDLLEELNFDGMRVTHSNALPDGADAFTARSVQHDGVVLFDAKQVKHTMADSFDEKSPMIFNMEIGGGIPEGTNGSIIMAAIDEPEFKINALPTGKFGELLEIDGKSRTFTGVASSMIKKRPLNETEVEVIRNSSAPKFLQGQSDRLNLMGARWLGSWFKNHFPEINSKFASKFMPINELLRNLPDSDGSLRKWFRRSTASIGQKQPESYNRIVKALRRDINSRQYQSLTPEERSVVDKIRQTLDAERIALRQSGFHVGYKKNYLPQVWNQTAIRKNKDEFIQGMAEYYTREQASLNKMPKEGEANHFATRMYLQLLEESEDGVFIPHKDVKGLTKNPGFDSVDFSRVLNIGDYPESLNAMEKFLENDLDAILVKYLEGSTRRLTHADKLGVNTHAIDDYLLTANEGVDGIAKLLSTNKSFKKSLRGMTQDGYIETSTLTDTIQMPFSGREFQAKEFAKRLIDAHTKGGSAVATKMLSDLMPKLSVTYKRRIDAIVGALDDFKGQKSSISYEDEKFIDGAMRVAMKKPLQGFGGRPMMQGSKLIRTVNNVSLLGFTTLTSLGDVVLPIIRSGSFTSWVKGLSKAATDPEYRRMLNNVGVAMENIVHERMVHMYGAPDNKLSHAFFSATLLTPWTDLQRKIAGATGLEAFKTMQAKAWNNWTDGVPYAQQNTTYKTAHRFLSRYGLQAYLPNKEHGKLSIGTPEAMERAELREGIIKFANDSIFQPNPDDIPLWAQTPIGQIVFQLKSFPLMMSRLGGHVFKEANQGNLKPLAYLALLGPAFGTVTLTAKDIIQQRGGEDGQSPDLRKRNLAKAIGWNSQTHGEDYDDFLGWYVEGMLIMGGLGLLGDVMHSVSSQADNGAYGQQRIWSTLLGPTYGLGNAAVTGVAGIQDAALGGDNSNAKERSAWRELATRIPIIGGVRSWREGIVDTMAGEQGGGKKTGNWGGSKDWGTDKGWGESKW